jgi:hypothetical protein
MMILDVRNAMAEAELTFDVTSEGHILPQVTQMNVRYNDSSIEYIGNWLENFLYKEWFKIQKYLSMAAINTYGKFYVNNMLPEYVRRLTNSQKHKFDLDLF